VPPRRAQPARRGLPVQNGFADVANVAGGIDAWSALRDAGVPRY
jgi:rhodanese-related sulfurtransferase